MSNRDIANLSMLSGDEDVANFGRATLTDAQRREFLEQRQAEFKAQQKAGSGYISLGDGFLFDPNKGETFRASELDDYDRLQHERRLELANTQKRTPSRGYSQADKTKIVDFDNQIQQGRSIVQGLTDNPDTVEPWTDTLGSGITKIGGTGLKNIYESNVKTPDELNVRNNMAQWFGSIRKALLGSAITGYELEKEAEWSPMAAGISTEESLRRMNNIIQDMESNRDSIIQFDDSYSGAPAQESAPEQRSESASQQWAIDADGNPVRVR